MVKKQRIRLQDVAARAGVSEATVSRVVNDRPGVKESTRREVRRLLDELGHEPPGLRRRAGTGLVGVVVPELENPVFPAFAQPCRGAPGAARLHDRRVLGDP